LSVAAEQLFLALASCRRDRGFLEHTSTDGLKPPRRPVVSRTRKTSSSALCCAGSSSLSQRSYI